MNGIDISNWQNGINLSKVPCDFVICKATEGKTYVSPDFDRQINQSLSLGKCTGVYHYINGVGAEAEANHFYSKIKNYVGRVIIVADWEPGSNSAWKNESYLDAFLKKINSLTGVPAMVYSSYSYFPWSVASNNNGGTWVAQYANNNATGYQSSPWNEGKYTCTIRQYSSSGRLSGYNGNLDLNKSYIDKATWDKYANPSGGVVNKPSTPNVNGDVVSLTARTMRGEFGNGDARKNALGSNYDAVQKIINHVAAASNDQLATDTINGMFGNGDDRKAILGNKYDAVQKIVNSRSGVNKKSIDEIAREVIRGDWGNGQTRKNKLTAAGYNYNEVQKRVNQMM